MSKEYRAERVYTVELNEQDCAAIAKCIVRAHGTEHEELIWALESELVERLTQRATTTDHRRAEGVAYLHTNSNNPMEYYWTLDDSEGMPIGRVQYKAQQVEFEYDGGGAGWL